MTSTPYSFIILDNPDQLASTESFVRNFSTEIKTMKNLPEFRTHMATVPADPNRIILIVSGAFGYELKPEFERGSYPQIHSIYVYCQNKVFHQRWASMIEKVKGVVTTPDDLTTKLKQNELINSPPIHIETTIVAPKVVETIEFSPIFISEIDIKHTIARLLINGISRINSDKPAKNLFVEVLTHMYTDDAEKLAICEEFSVNYSSAEPMRWMWRDLCFSKCLADAIKTGDPETVLMCGFLFDDLTKQFEQNKCRTAVQLYFGSRLSIDIIEQLKQLRNRFIVFPSFLTGSNDRNVAVSKANAEDATGNSRGVIFTIKADPTTEDANVFASAQSLGGMNLDNQYVFMVGSLFKIDDVIDDPNGPTNVQMTLCGHDDNADNKLIYDHFKRTYVDDGEYSYSKYLHLLADIGKNCQQPQLLTCAHNCAQQFIDFTSNEWEKMNYYDILAMIDYERGDLQTSIEWHRKSIDLKEKQLEIKQPILAKSYEDIAQAYQAKGEFTQAIQYFQKALDLLISVGAPVEPDLHISHVRLAAAYEADEKYREALCSYLQAIALMIKYDCENWNMIGIIHHNTANIFQYLQMYPLALGFYQSAIEAKKRAFTGAHTIFLSSYKNLGKLFRQLNENDKARECFEHAINIYQELKMQDTADFQETQQQINELTNPTET